MENLNCTKVEAAAESIDKLTELSAGSRFSMWYLYLWRNANSCIRDIHYAFESQNRKRCVFGHSNVSMFALVLDYGCSAVVYCSRKTNLRQYLLFECRLNEQEQNSHRDARCVLITSMCVQKFARKFSFGIVWFQCNSATIHIYLLEIQKANINRQRSMSKYTSVVFACTSPKIPPKLIAGSKFCCKNSQINITNL